MQSGLAWQLVPHSHPLPLRTQTWPAGQLSFSGRHALHVLRVRSQRGVPPLQSRSDRHMPHAAGVSAQFSMSVAVSTLVLLPPHPATERRSATPIDVARVEFMEATNERGSAHHTGQTDTA